MNRLEVHREDSSSNITVSISKNWLITAGIIGTLIIGAGFGGGGVAIIFMIKEQFTLWGVLAVSGIAIGGTLSAEAILAGIIFIAISLSRQTKERDYIPYDIHPPAPGRISVNNIPPAPQNIEAPSPPKKMAEITKEDLKAFLIAKNDQDNLCHVENIPAEALLKIAEVLERLQKDFMSCLNEGRNYNRVEYSIGKSNHCISIRFKGQINATQSGRFMTDFDKGTPNYYFIDLPNYTMCQVLIGSLCYNYSGEILGWTELRDWMSIQLILKTMDGAPWSEVPEGLKHEMGNSNFFHAESKQHPNGKVFNVDDKCQFRHE